MGSMIILPLIAAIIGFIIAFICFIGIFLLIIGITGILMNTIHKKKEQTQNCVSNPIYNICSLILGAALILLPFGFLLYYIFSSLLK